MCLCQRGNEDLTEEDLWTSDRVHDPGGELTIVNRDVWPHRGEAQAFAFGDLAISGGHRQHGIVSAIPQREGQADEWIEVAVRSPRGDDDTSHLVLAEREPEWRAYRWHAFAGQLDGEDAPSRVHKSKARRQYSLKIR